MFSRFTINYTYTTRRYGRAVPQTTTLIAQSVCDVFTLMNRLGARYTFVSVTRTAL